ncbi:unnamed protein product [Orchesella dallaii]|uniref:Uncharacterized protein n=1 Tax=Orchesella dallaii TaxID=48710 RepID=A0ABP1PWT4_9HEXA
MYKAAIVLALAAVVSAGNVAYLDTHVGSQVEQTVRGYGGLSSLSHQAKTVNSAFSTASAYKTKATNSAYAVAPAVAYAQPAVAYAQAAPVAYAQPAYAAPIARAVAPVAYAQPAYAAPIARAVAPVAKVAPAGLLGVAYSPVTAGVASLTFDGFGVHYGY